MTTPAAFDALALDYDAQFTESVLGRLMRRAVWRWLDAAFSSGERVLELGCGTGEDAVHLAQRGVRVVATDASPAMLDVARAKVDTAGLAGSVELRTLGIDDIDRLDGNPGAFDGAFSNFGGLNCVADLSRVARALGVLLRPGARVILCVMGPLVPWEWAWLVGHGSPRHALRRLSDAGVRWRGLTVRYPTIRATRRAFSPYFLTRRTGAIGVLLPPSYAEPWARKHRALVERLDRWERRIEQWPIVPWLADHYLVELERR